MAVTLVDPNGLPKHPAYRQLSIATGSRLVFLAGQAARDDQGRTIGNGDLAAQVEQAYTNISTAMADIGGSFDDVTRLTVYVVDWHPEKMSLLAEGMTRAAKKLQTDLAKPGTLVGVAALAEPDLLVEVEATAVLG
jgi:enamine deaminase RidA (YjgF/YER057c/UK114 family)